MQLVVCKNLILPSSTLSSVQVKPCQQKGSSCGGNDAEGLFTEGEVLVSIALSGLGGVGGREEDGGVAASDEAA